MPKQRKSSRACTVLILDNMERYVFRAADGSGFIDANDLVAVLDLGTDISLTQDTFLIGSQGFQDWQGLLWRHGIGIVF